MKQNHMSFHPVYRQLKRMLTLCNTLIVAALLFSGPGHAGYEQREDVQSFINMMVEKHDYDRDLLTSWFEKAVKQEATIKSLDKPAESMPWHRYRKIFMTDKRINKGVEFWMENRQTLERAHATYGVPPEIITAIIGVETFYGKFKGKFPVFDTLTTIAFDYPKRASFFKKELEQYLLLIREEQLDAYTLKGSYAGALGKPQFISSSYRHYAVDFDNDGKRDLLENTVDAIGSVANYFKKHGWKDGDAITVTARYKSGKKFSEYPMKPENSISKLSQYGVFPSQPVRSSALATPIQLEQEDHMEYWLGLHNFYVITRYNHSNLYAMAVYQLSQSIKQRMK
ncbi:MAG: lytic murein transglycosylase B [Gammaproteobacteria bacterium]|nr:lytic murein transglycosylase B [Gammaproteobacteria bacterium]